LRKNDVVAGSNFREQRVNCVQSRSLTHGVVMAFYAMVTYYGSLVQLGLLAQTFLQVTMAKIHINTPTATTCINHCASFPSQEDTTAMPNNSPSNESSPARHLNQESTERSNVVENCSSRPPLSCTTTGSLAQSDNDNGRCHQEFVAMRQRKIGRHYLAFAIDLMTELDDDEGLFLTDDESSISDSD